MKATVLCVLALVACAFARTASKTPAITPHITSLTDKDARTKAATHPAFANAGKQAGIEIWRIENFDPVPVSAANYGKFHKGDSYIILKTNSDKRGNLSWDIHYWIGTESTQDESGAAAILTVGLDDKFNGAAVQHREPMGYESNQFKGYFQPAISYLEGGVASGFNHVTTNAGAEKRLIQVKGKRNVRVRQVDPVISSMNKGDVFILDKDQDVYVYVGEKAKIVEKMKAISVANQIRDQDHRGRARVEIIDAYSSEADVQKFFTALGSGSKQLVPEESAGGDDQQFETSEEQTVTLSEVSDSIGSVKVTPLPKPFRQEQLKPQEAYILDTVSGSIYVWIGKQATEKEKSEAMAKAQGYLTTKKYPSWVRVTRVPQGTEQAMFKQYFSTWRDVGMSHNRVVRSARSKGLDAQAQPPLLFKVGINSRNELAFYLAHKFQQTELEEDGVYVVDASGRVFVWIGSEAPQRLRKSTHVGDEYNSYRGLNKEVILTKKGMEPETFTELFDDWDPQMWLKRKNEWDSEAELELNEIDVDK